MADMELRPLHFSMSVRDLEESMAWYEKHLGFRAVFSMYLAQHHAKLAFMRNGSFEIEMFQHDSTKPLPEERLDPHEDQKTQGAKHMAFLVDDVQALADRFTAEGVKVVVQPKIMENKEANVREKICFIQDPTGINLEFIQRNL